MSGKLQIEFASDMPQATVEVVSPDLQTVGRLWLGPGRTDNIEVPSEASFLRVHLASGDVVTLKDPGNLNRTIERSILDRELQTRARSSAPKSKRMRMDTSDQSSDPIQDLTAIAFENLFTAKLLSSAGVGSPRQIQPDGPAVTLTAPHSQDPYDLEIEGPGMKLSVRVPGLLEDLSIQLDRLDDGRQVVLVRVRTGNPTADAISGYMTRGDLYSASAMTSWTDQAEDLVEGKISDPFSAAVGAYLLLRLRSFDRLRDWARNLANLFPQMSDGSIIWAWQQILMRGSESEIHKYFERAVSGKLPVYTEGLRLLRDGLRMLGPGAKGQTEALNARAGVVLWNSPFTASLTGSKSATSSPIEFDIDYATNR